MLKRVLLCDDEVHILRAAEIKVSRAGLEVQCASDGQQAWEIIRANPPDIIVTDYQMPRMDGLQLARQVRENPDTHDLPIIMLTAKGFELTAAELAADYGVSALLAKPFSPRELLNLIQKTLETSTYQPPVFVA